VGDGGFVGRQSAVADLRRAVDKAVAGQGRLALIVGEAGMGKTALAGEAAGYAVDQGAELLWATCWDGDGAPAYWPWVQILREFGATRGPLAGEVARIMPDVTTAVDRTAGGPLSPVPVESGRDRFMLFDAIGSTLVAASRVRPLVMVIDDLQWADVPSLLLLDFLAGRLARAPMLVVGTFRDDEVDAGHPRRPVLAEVSRDADLITLAGLAQAEVARLMGAVAGVGPDRELAAGVFRRTGGNPFFVREVTRLLVSRGGLAEGTASGGGIPDGVRQVVAQRLARLPQTCVSLLSVIAVAGREVGIDLLARVGGCEPGVVAHEVETAVRGRVLAEPPGPAGPYRFCHDLFRETVYAGLATRTRVELHLRLARALEEPGAQPFTRHPAQLAQHFLVAAIGHPATPALADKAVRYCLSAAAEAVERLAHEDAVGHCQRTLDGLTLAGILTAEATSSLLLGRADALRRAGDIEAAREDYRRAAQLARASGEVAQFARAALGVHALGVESGTPRDACIELLDEALDQLADEDSAIKAQVLAALARELFLSGIDQRVRAARLSSAAVDIARRVRDDVTLAVCLLACHDTIWLPGAAVRRRAIATEMATVARRSGDRAFEAEAWLLRASAGLELADPAALDDLDEFLQRGMAVGQPHYMYLVLTRRANRAIMVGRFADAERLLAEASDLGAAIGEPDAWNVQIRLLWEMRSAQGRRADAEEQLRACSLAHLKYWYEALVGLALAERGERAEAVRAIAPAVQHRPEQLPFNYVITAQWTELGEAAAVAGLSEACQRFYDALRPHAGTAVVVAAAVGFGGAVDHHLGTLAMALGRLDEAARHLEDALVIHERMSAWPWLARTRCELAAVLVARDLPADRGRVTQLLADVAQAAREFAMPGLLRRVEQLTQVPVNLFHDEGDTWRIVYAGQEIRLAAAKGLTDIAALLRAEGRDVPAMALAGAHRPGLAAFGADPVLDRTAQQQYRARLAELDDTLDEAERDHDPERASAAADERAFLIRELASAVGLGHRERQLGDDRERARKAVTGRIKDALRRIEAHHPALGAHLSQSITTGNLCSYRPVEPVRWRH
jgi:tetratricopeptide (TPR) repeat protein